MAARLTMRGAKTRSRIVATAADLMRVRGVGGTNLDDVVSASKVSKSQLYRHFEDKPALVRGGDRVCGRAKNSRRTRTLGQREDVLGPTALEGCGRRKQRLARGQVRVSIGFAGERSLRSRLDRRQEAPRPVHGLARTLRRSPSPVSAGWCYPARGSTSSLMLRMLSLQHVGTA